MTGFGNEPEQGLNPELTFENPCDNLMKKL